jgi:hypothetical protein
MNRIQQIGEHGFEGANNVEIIDLSENLIKRIEFYDFNCLKNLKEIDLSSNNINFIHHNSFNLISNVNKINLSHNKLEYLNKIIFKQLVNLKEIGLSNNLFKEINFNLFIGLNKLDKVYFLNMENLDPTFTLPNVLEGINEMVIFEFNINKDDDKNNWLLKLIENNKCESCKKIFDEDLDKASFIFVRSPCCGLTFCYECYNDMLTLTNLCSKCNFMIKNKSMNNIANKIFIF